MRTKQTGEEKEYTKVSNPYPDEFILANQLFRSVQFVLHPQENGLILKTGDTGFTSFDRKTNARIQISVRKENVSSVFCMSRKSLRIPLLNRVYKEVKIDPTSLVPGQYYLKYTPGTAIIAAILLVIWFILWNNKVDVTRVASSYVSVVRQGEVWRILSSSLSHLGILHMAMNVSSLLSLSSIELQWGSIQYLSISVWLMVFTEILLMTLYSLLIRLGYMRFLDVWGVGYSCVLFALMTVSLLTDHSPCSVNFFGICFPTYQIPIPFTRIRIPVNLFPFVQLILMKVLIPNSSLLGHLSGILLGLLLSTGLAQFISPIGCLCTIEVAYLLYHRYMKIRSSSDVEASPINHMVNSDTNAKYTIVHNISFFTLLGSSLGILLLPLCQEVHIDILWMSFSGLLGIFICICIKHYTRNGQLPGLLVLHFILMLINVASCVFRFVFNYSAVFEEPNLSRYTKALLIMYLVLSVSILSLLDTMNNLSTSYPSWFNKVVKFLLEQSKSTHKYVVNGFVFHNKMKRYEALSGTQ